MNARPIVHIEIPAADNDVAGRFYKDMFDWKYEHMPEPMAYTTFEAGNTGGGFISLEQAEPGDIYLYIASDDIEADLAKIEKLGGKILESKSEVPGFGWYAIFTDPTGNKLALWTSAQEDS